MSKYKNDEDFLKNASKDELKKALDTLKKDLEETEKIVKAREIMRDVEIWD